MHNYKCMMVVMMMVTGDVCCVSVFRVTPSKNKVMVCRSFTV